MSVRALGLLPLVWLVLPGGVGASACAGPEDARLEGLYRARCAACHDSGAAGAPRRGASRVWQERDRGSDDEMFARVVVGTPSMPPRGGCDGCSDGDLMALVRLVSR